MMLPRANLFNIQHFSLDDGPGIRTVVFFKGCPLDCAWCHNPESKCGATELFFYDKKCTRCGACEAVCSRGAHTVRGGWHEIDRARCIACGKCADACASGALEVAGRSWAIDEIMADIAKDDVFFADGGGVTFSGGEPFGQFDALYELLARCKQKNYSTCIETSGFTSAENIKKAAKYTDWFLYDCKETDADNHVKYVGVRNQLILKNLTLLDDLSANVVLRCPIIPAVNDREEHAQAIAALANSHPCIKKIELMPYHPLGITKAEQIGKRCLYENPSFLEREILERLASVIREKTEKPLIAQANGS